MKLLIAGLLIVHGLIVAAQSSGSFGSARPIPNPAWLGWWPTGLGGSWLISGLHLQRTPAQVLAGVLWLTAGAMLVLAGLGIFGFVVPFAWWRNLALAGAGLSLAMLVVYLHPFFAVGMAASALTLAALASTAWPILQRFGI